MQLSNGNGSLEYPAEFEALKVIRATKKVGRRMSYVHKGFYQRHSRELFPCRACEQHCASPRSSPL